MANPNPTPKFIYRIYANTSPFEIPFLHSPDFIFPWAALDRDTGFFHMSSLSQLSGTLQRFFSSNDTVQLVKIDYAKLTAEETVRWDMADDGDTYPHLYASLRGQFVNEVKVISKGESWSESVNQLIKEGWLED